MEEQQKQKPKRRRRKPWENWGGNEQEPRYPQNLTHNQLLYRLCVAVEDLCNAIKDTGRVR